MARPTLSLCITARSDPWRLRALLELLRPHVDEIVLSVDADGDLDALDACADLADRRFVHRLDRNPNWLAAWIQSECTSDWVLRLDDDEVPSAALLDELPRLLADRYVAAYQLPRRWLTETDRYVSDFPWALETLVRLVRNQPGLWHMDGELHSAGSWEGEIRLAEGPIYHLDVAATPLDVRRAKVARYARNGPRTVLEGLDVNRFYLPEDFDGLATAPVPDADRAAIARLLDPPSQPVGDALAAVERVGTEEIARHNRGPSAGTGELSGSVRVAVGRERCPAGSRRHFLIEIENTGGDAWWRTLPWQPPTVAVVWRWLDGNDGDGAPAGAAPPPSTVFPGQRVRLWIAVEVPAGEGPRRLELCLARGGVERFGDPFAAPVSIGPPEPALPDTIDPLSRRELDLIERERHAERMRDSAEAFARTRRYRLAAALGRPVDRLRGALRRQRRG